MAESCLSSAIAFPARAARRVRDRAAKCAGRYLGIGTHESLYLSSRRVIFLVDTLIGFTVGYLVYAVEWSHLREQAILFVIWFLSIFNYMVKNNAFVWENLRIAVGIDGSVILLSAVVSSCCREFRTKMTGTLILAAASVPLSLYLMFRHGIVINSFPILCVLMLTLSVAHHSSRKSARERSRIARERACAEFAIVSHISHSVRPQILIARAPLLSLKSWLEERGLLGEELPATLLNGTRETVGEALEKVSATLGQINGVVGNARTLIGREIPADEFQDTDLPTLFSGEIVPLYSGFDFEITVTGGTSRPLPLHRASFVEALHNIIRNAATHSFPSGFRAEGGNRLHFHIRENVRYVFIDYTNNGQPFPENLDAAAFLTFGRKSSDSPGEGLGGAWIGKVLEAHDGTLDIMRDHHPVHFRITLPKRSHHGKHLRRDHPSHR
ncbi:MAG: sensor histidine kinase [Geobacteraceae bacterium]|nr:sensor histidine kinase [Geobacteraceae bacterium]